MTPHEKRQMQREVDRNFDYYDDTPIKEEIMLTPRQIIEGLGCEYRGLQETLSGPWLHTFNAPSGSTLMLAEVTPEKVVARLAEHDAVFLQAPALEAPALRSLSEAVNTCPGWNEECGDEIPADRDLCATHRRDEDAHYTRLAQEQDRREAEMSASQYRIQYLERKEGIQYGK